MCEPTVGVDLEATFEVGLVPESEGVGLTVVGAPMSVLPVVEEALPATLVRAVGASTCASLAPVAALTVGLASTGGPAVEASKSVQRPIPEDVGLVIARASGLLSVAATVGLDDLGSTVVVAALATLACLVPAEAMTEHILATRVAATAVPFTVDGGAGWGSVKGGLTITGGTEPIALLPTSAKKFVYTLF